MAERVGGFFRNIGGRISETWNNARERTRNFVSGVRERIGSLPGPAGRVFGAIRDSVSENWDSSASLTQNLRNVMSGAFSSIRERASEGFSAIRGIISDNWDSSASLTENFKNVAQGIFGKLPDGIRDRISRIGEIFSNLWNRVRDGVRNLVDRIIEFFRPVTRIIEGVGNTIGRIFGGGGNNSSASVPAYASGGIVTRPHFGLVGEAGPEAIIPLKNDNNSRGIWERAGELAGFAPSASAAGSGGDSISIPINLNITVPGGGDAAKAVRSAGADICNQVKQIVRGEVPNIIAEIQRGKVRTAF